MNYQIKLLNKCCDSAGVYKAARDIPKKEKKSPFMLVGGCMAHHTNIFLKDLIVKFSRVENNQECHNDRNNSWLKHFLPTCCVFEGESDSGY